MYHQAAGYLCRFSHLRVSVTQSSRLSFPQQQTQQERTKGSTSYLVSYLASYLVSYLVSYLASYLAQLMPPGRHKERGPV